MQVVYMLNYTGRYATEMMSEPNATSERINNSKVSIKCHHSEAEDGGDRRHERRVVKLTGYLNVMEIKHSYADRHLKYCNQQISHCHVYKQETCQISCCRFFPHDVDQQCVSSQIYNHCYDINNGEAHFSNACHVLKNKREDIFFKVVKNDF